MRVALLITCLTDNFYPRVGVALVKVLEHLGHEVVFPEAQTCCGQPMFNNGFYKEARVLARRMIRVFESFDAVVTPSASCAAMIRKHYPGLFATESSDRRAAVGLSGRTFEFAEFLTKVLKVDMKALNVRWPGRAAFHCSCHMRGTDSADGTARLAAGVQGLEVVLLESTPQCCGFGGTFSVKYPEISGAMVGDKLTSISAAEADTLICNEAGCTMNIAGASRRRARTVTIRHIAEILAEGMGLLEQGGQS